MITTCVLLYDGYLDQASRCLESIANTRLGIEIVTDLRIGLNTVSDEVASFAHDWAASFRASSGRRVTVYSAPTNSLKYPMCRKMFFDKDRPLAQYVMWFDDDSYLARYPDFWNAVVREMVDADMIGQIWGKKWDGNTPRWISSQVWVDKAIDIGLPISFCTGAWWTIRSSVLEKYDWPWPELRHRGGDMSLGELFRHRHLRMRNFAQGVRINADEAGQHSKAPRRGLSIGSLEKELGHDFDGTRALRTDHQDFQVTVRDY